MGKIIEEQAVKLLLLVMEMRMAQRNYLAAENHSEEEKLALIEAKKMEKEFDDRIIQFCKDLSKNRGK